MSSGRIITWDGELVVDLPEEIFDGNPPQAVMFDAMADRTKGTITVTYSIGGTRRMRPYEPGFQGGRFPLLVDAEINSVGWCQGQSVKAVFTAPATLTIFK